MNPRDEEGQALLLALAVLIFFGLVIGALLSFADASVRTTEGLRVQRNIAYAADGATDLAVQYVRGDPSRGAFGIPKCTGCSTVTLNGVAATVDWASVADPRDLDRTVQFTTSVGGTIRVVAKVLFHDNSGGSCTIQPCIDVLSWTYVR